MIGQIRRLSVKLDGVDSDHATNGTSDRHHRARRRWFRVVVSRTRHRKPRCVYRRGPGEPRRSIDAVFRNGRPFRGEAAVPRRRACDPGRGTGWVGFEFSRAWRFAGFLNNMVFSRYASAAVTASCKSGQGTRLSRFRFRFTMPSEQALCRAHRQPGTLDGVARMWAPVWRHYPAMNGAEFYRSKLTDSRLIRPIVMPARR